MSDLRDYPALVFILAFVALWSATQIGVTTLRRQRALEAEVGEHYGLIVGATLSGATLSVVQAELWPRTASSSAIRRPWSR
jgi:hypothetical protein